MSNNSNDYNRPQKSISWAMYFLAWLVKEKQNNNTTNSTIAQLLDEIHPGVLDIASHVVRCKDAIPIVDDIEIVDNIPVDDQYFDEMSINAQEEHLQSIVTDCKMLKHPTDLYDLSSPISVYIRHADILPTHLFDNSYYLQNGDQYDFDNDDSDDNKCQ